jgi:hypothetical protein
MLDDTLFGALWTTERLLLNALWLNSHVTSHRSVLRDRERTREVAFETAGDEGRTFNDGELGGA